MAMSKEEIDRRVEELQKTADRLQDQVRVEWLNRVCREARCDMCLREWRKRHPPQVKLDGFIQA